MRLRPFSRFVTSVTLAWVLGGCGKLDDLDGLASPDAADYCGQAARVTVHRSRDDDGSTDFEILQYDEHDNLLLQLANLDDEGKFQQREVFRWHYVEGDNWTLATRDSMGDGTIDETTIRDLDAHGNIVSERHDRDGDGNFEFTRISTYDENDRELTQNTDENADGELDAFATVTYDDEGRHLTHSFDSLLDDEPPTLSETTYDPDGGYVRTTDKGSDGTVDSRATLTYSEDGAIRTGEFDDGADGTIDSRSRTTYDNEGRETEVLRDEDGDGSYEYVERKVYGDSGELEFEATDLDGDGEPEWAIAYERDQSGRLLATESLTPDYGLVTRSTYEYDRTTTKRTAITTRNGELERTCWSTSVTETEAPLLDACDDDADGQLDRVTTYVDCP